MNPQEQFCLNPSCHASRKKGGENIKIHSRKEKRYRCMCCRKTFTESKGTAVYGIKKPVEQFVQVTTLLAHGCPVQAIVAAFGLDERTVASWEKKAGSHCEAVHAHLIHQNALDLGQVQADEIKVKCQGGTLWMAMAIMVSCRLWLGGVVSSQRDKQLIGQLMLLVRQSALCRPLLIAVDGLKSYISGTQKSFRSPLPTGKRGRPRLISWPDVAIVQVVKRRVGKALEIERRIAQGSPTMIQQLIDDSQGTGVINTAFIERLNATFRQRIAALARRTRSLPRTAESVTAAMYLVGTVYNFCSWHDSLRLPLYIGHRGKRRWVQRTPAIAAGLTDHLWSVHELLHFKPPTIYGPPTRRGRPHKSLCHCGSS